LSQCHAVVSCTLASEFLRWVSIFHEHVGLFCLNA